MSARAPRAAVLSIGDELVLGTTLDTNSRTVARALRDVGYATVEHRTVGDDLAAIATAMRELAGSHPLLVTTGGLGPTDDDLTREALNILLDEGAPMVEDPERRRELMAWFAGRGRAMPDINLRQVMHPRSARTLPNPRGTAPGLAARYMDAQVFCLPGPPGEMVPMLEEHVLPGLRAAGLPPVVRVAVHIFGLGESQVAQQLGQRLERGRHPAVGTTASGSIVSVQIVATGADAATCAAAEAAECTTILQPYVFGRGGQTLADALVEKLRETGRTLAVAESCTGGMIGAEIAGVPGASASFLGGWITYANEVKRDQLGVPEEVLRTHGAVSAPCAEAMARGAAVRAGANLAIAVTGIAGPDGGTPEKPVGTVFIAVHHRGSDAPGASDGTLVRRFQFPGDRQTVRRRTTCAALQLARWRLCGVDAPLLWENT